MTNRPTLSRFRRGPSVWGAVSLVCLLFALAVQPALGATLPWDIANSDFETWSGGAPASWWIQPGGTVQASASSHSGTFSLLFNDPNTSGLSARMLAPGSAVASMPVTQYRKYRFAAWAQSDRGAASPTLHMWFTNDAGTMIGSKHIVRGDEFGVSSSTWKQMQIARSAPLGATKIVVQLGMYGGSGGGIRFDDVQLDEVNSSAGTIDDYSGWRVDRSADLGSGFGVNEPAGGLVSFTAPGGVGYELNGSARIFRTFVRPIESFSFRVTFSPLWDSSRLQPIVWSYLDVNGVPTHGVVQGIYTPDADFQQDVTLTGVNSKRIDFTCTAVRGPSDNEMVATFSNVRAIGSVWRFRNIKNGFYLWTADPAERDRIIATLPGVWTFEGPAYQINVAHALNQAPLWRFLNIKGGYYLYTADANEKNRIVSTLAKTWRLEGEAYRVSMNSSGAPVWRFRNKHNGTYLFTSDVAEKNIITTLRYMDWTLEGAAYYLAP